MAKNKSHSIKRGKAAKDNRPRATGRSGKIGSGKVGIAGQALPSPRVTASQVDALVAVVQGLDRRLRNFERRQQAEHMRLEQERQEREQQSSACAPPSPHDAAFAALPGFMAEMRERVVGIEARLQQSPRDRSLDVPASILAQRRVFSGACKTLGIEQPTPAIIGRVMHDNAIYTPNDDKAPRRLLQLIYAKRNVPDHLSPEIRVLLERYENRVSESNAESTTSASTSNGQQSDESSGRSSSRVAKGIGLEFDRRFDLIVNTVCGRKDPVQSGRRTNYRRYLTAAGRELFNGWPEWTDATGGTGLADEQAGTAPTQPERTGPDDGPTLPAT